MIELLMPTTEQFAAHERMAALPKISRELGADSTDEALAEKERRARMNCYYVLRKKLAMANMTDAARTVAINAAYRAAYPEKFTNA